MPRRKDLTGLRFGKLVAIESTGSDRWGRRTWKCKCDCGNYTTVSIGNLTSGLTRSCGCSHKASGIPNRRDLAGKRYGHLVAIEDVGNATNRQRNWLCKCDCGNNHIVTSHALLSGNTTSCGCSKKTNPNLRIDLTGLRFGKLVAIKDVGGYGGHRFWKCQCDCGNFTNVPTNNLRNGKTKSCGCWLLECNSRDRSHLWRGGKSFAPYCPAFSRKLKEEVRDEFGRRCFLCGDPENGKHLDVHHVDYNKSQGCSGYKWALIPLCHSCHMKTSIQRFHYYHVLRDYWIYKHIDFNSGFNI